MIRLGWTLVALGLGGYLLTAVLAWSSWWVPACSGVLWLAALALGEGYRDDVRTMDLDDACDLIDAERQAFRR